MFKIFRIFYRDDRDNWEEHRTYTYSYFAGTIEECETEVNKLHNKSKTNLNYRGIEYDYEELEVDNLEENIFQFAEMIIAKNFNKNIKLGNCWYCHKENTILDTNDGDNDQICLECQKLYE